MSLNNNILHYFLAPNGVVTNMEAAKLTYTSITIRWQNVLCLEQNGNITHYNIQYNESSAIVLQNITKMSFTATSLFPGTSYTFKVAAINSKGIGPDHSQEFQTLMPKGKQIYYVGLHKNNYTVDLQMLDF